MVVTNEKTGDSYSNVWYSKVAELIGIASGKTIKRWEVKAMDEGRKTEEFNGWKIYFDEIKLKQKKGTTLK